MGFVLKVKWGHLPHTRSSWHFELELPFSTDSHFCCNTTYMLPKINMLHKMTQ